MSEHVKSFKDTSVAKTSVTKAEKKVLRQQANSEWKNINRASWNDKDANPRHTLYYKTQLSELESEWTQFHETMARDLPVTFRISERCPPVVRVGIATKLEKDFKKLRGRFVEVKGQVISHDLVVPIKWYPDAYQVSNCDSSTLAKQPSLQPLYQYIAREVNLGHIVRQELVSMIPAYLLNVKHDSFVLDMCAAPGSKTEQLLALMHQDHRAFRQSHPSQASPLPAGVVVANDSDPKRINTLLNRFIHWGSTNLMFTCCRAEDFTQYFQQQQQHHAETKSGAMVSKFDRILCDVPCSGDGTFRKCPHLWRLFRPRGSLDFHTIQLQIVTAGIELLTVGGRLVYSTCSLNPIEDEAVVAALLIRFKNQIRLVDTRAEGLLPHLKSREGISHWECSTDILTVGEEDASARSESVSRLPKILPSMLPPSAVEAASMHLSRCLRIMPHDQDTGGFFVAVFEKFAGESTVAVGVEKQSVKNGNKKDTVSSTSNSVQVVHRSGQLTKHQQHQKNVNNSNTDIAQSLSAMKRLGYNPKNMNLSGSSGESATAMGYLVACTDMTDDHQQAVVNALGLNEELFNSTEHSSSGSTGQYKLMCSEISKEFSSIKTNKSVPDEEVDKKPVTKKPKYNGIFGTKSQGWAIQTEQEEDDDEGNQQQAITGPTHRLVMMSHSVYEALHSWGKRLFIVQAGASIAIGQWKRSEGVFQQLTLDDSGVDVLHAVLREDRRLHLNLSDFMLFLSRGIPKKVLPVAVKPNEDNDDNIDNKDNVDSNEVMESEEVVEESEESEESESLLIKRKYCENVDYLVKEDELIKDQLMLSSTGCARVYEVVDNIMESKEELDDSVLNIVATDVIVSVNEESWSACTTSNHSSDGVGGVNESHHVKRRLSKAEKKKLKNNAGTISTPAVNDNVNDSAPTSEKCVTAEGLQVVLNFEAALTMNKKQTKYTGYNLVLDVMSPEHICASALDVVNACVNK